MGEKEIREFKTEYITLKEKKHTIEIKRAELDLELIKVKGELSLLTARMSDTAVMHW